MVDDGLREPSATIAALSAPCPLSSALAGRRPRQPRPACHASAARPRACRCRRAVPAPIARAGTHARAPPSPKPRAIRDPAAALRAGISKGVRGSCERRTTGLVTGSLAALDCHPDSSRVKLATWWLLRPADARFTFAARMAQYALQGAATALPGCRASRARAPACRSAASWTRTAAPTCGSRAAPPAPVSMWGCSAQIGTSRRSGPPGRVGRHRLDRTRTALAACRSGDSGVSAPPAPTNVRFRVHLPAADRRRDPAVSPRGHLGRERDRRYHHRGCRRHPLPDSGTQNGTYCIHRTPDCRRPSCASSPRHPPATAPSPGSWILAGRTSVEPSRSTATGRSMASSRGL